MPDLQPGTKPRRRRMGPAAITAAAAVLVAAAVMGSARATTPAPAPTLGPAAPILVWGRGTGALGPRPAERASAAPAGPTATPMVPCGLSGDDLGPGARVLSVAITFFWGLAAVRDGHGVSRVYAWGYNTDGQLGTGTTSNLVQCAAPVKADATHDFTGAVAVAAGGQGSSFAVRKDGTLWAWGWNFGGQLGTGGGHPVLYPMPVRIGSAAGPLLRGVTQVEPGPWSSLAVAGGTAYGWGTAQQGERGDGSVAQTFFAGPVSNTAGTGPLRGVTAVSIYGSSAYAVAGGQLYRWGQDVLRPVLSTKQLPADPRHPDTTTVAMRGILDNTSSLVDADGSLATSRDRILYVGSTPVTATACGQELAGVVALDTGRNGAGRAFVTDDGVVWVRQNNDFPPDFTPAPAPDCTSTTLPFKVARVSGARGASLTNDNIAVW